MKTTNRIVPIALAAALALAAPASAQFSKYVALGDSLTAGVEGNCLVERNQRNSFPAVIARQLAIGDFQQPLMDEVAADDPLGLAPCLGAVFVPPSSISVGTVSQMGFPLNSTLLRPYDNLGVPGANVDDLVDLTHGNPSGSTAEIFAVFVLRNVPGSPLDGLSAVTQANSLGPDLVTLWAGSNDILTAALTGLVLPGVTVTPVAEFDAHYAEVLTNVVQTGRTLVAANVPDITAIPFATTVPSRLAIPGGSVPVLGPGNAAYPCQPVAPDSGCPVPDGTLVTLPASTLLASGIGVPVALGGTGQPLPDGRFTPPATVEAGVLLYPDEVVAITALIDGYNGIIQGRIAGAGGALVNIHDLFNDIAAHGYHIGGLTLSRSFLTGGIFSADGFHASSIGYRIVADEFIKAMNEQLGLDVPRPSFSDVLFTPNVPQTGGAVRGGGENAYTFGMWRQLLVTTRAARGFTVSLPELPEAPSRGGRTRVLVPRGND